MLSKFEKENVITKLNLVYEEYVKNPNEVNKARYETLMEFCFMELDIGIVRTEHGTHVFSKDGVACHNSRHLPE